MSVSRPLTDSQIAELRRQLGILESKAAQATEPIVRDALLSKIAQIKRDLGETSEPAASAAKAYHLNIGGAAQGPMDATTVQAMIAAGQAVKETPVWVQGMAAWQPLEGFSEFTFDAIPDIRAVEGAAPQSPQEPDLASTAPEARRDGAPAVQSRAEPDLTSSQTSDTPTPSQKKKRWEDDIVLPQPASPEQIRQADEILRQARISKMRGGAQEYTRLLGDAQRIAPGAASVLEAVGDDLLEKGNPGEARVAYYKAHRMAPKNVQIERKYAEVVFQASANSSWQTKAMLEGEAVENAKRAAVLSAFVPGVGQIVLGDRLKGGIMAGIWLFSILGITIYIRAVAGTHAKPSAFVIGLVGLFIVNWIVSILDCSNRAKGKGDTAGLMAYVNDGKTPVRKDKKERPIPPENLPFE